MRGVRRFVVVLVLAAAAHAAPELPADLEGRPEDWTSLAGAALATDHAPRWKSGEAGVRTQEFEVDGAAPSFDKVRMCSWLTAFRMGPWHVTYRVTAPKARRDDALARLEAMLDELALPPTGIVSAPR